MLWGVLISTLFVMERLKAKLDPIDLPQGCKLYNLPVFVVKASGAPDKWEQPRKLIAAPLFSCGAIFTCDELTWTKKASKPPQKLQTDWPQKNHLGTTGVAKSPLKLQPKTPFESQGINPSINSWLWDKSLLSPLAVWCWLDCLALGDMFFRNIVSATMN